MKLCLFCRVDSSSFPLTPCFFFHRLPLSHSVTTLCSGLDADHGRIWICSVLNVVWQQSVCERISLPGTRLFRHFFFVRLCFILYIASRRLPLLTLSPLPPIPCSIQYSEGMHLQLLYLLYCTLKFPRWTHDWTDTGRELWKLSVHLFHSFCWHCIIIIFFFFLLTLTLTKSSASGFGHLTQIDRTLSQKPGSLCPGHVACSKKSKAVQNKYLH